jgi:hypothetical protein
MAITKGKTKASMLFSTISTTIIKVIRTSIFIVPNDPKAIAVRREIAVLMDRMDKIKIDELAPWDNTRIIGLADAQFDYTGYPFAATEWVNV